jgi:hypothetical protein
MNELALVNQAENWHRLKALVLDSVVEPVAINRWARFSVNRTLPGLFMAILLQRLAGWPTGERND